MNTEITFEPVYEDPDSYYKTTDVDIGSVMIATEHELLDTNYNDPENVVFIFRRTDDIERIENKHISEGVQVNSRDLLNARRELIKKARKQS